MMKSDSENENLVELRRRAEAAVADMAEGPLKTKAFEVFLMELLRNSHSIHTPPEPRSRADREGKRHSQTSIPGRILGLRDAGFFREQRTIAEIRAELMKQGWHIPATTLSGRLQGLVQQRKLRRE